MPPSHHCCPPAPTYDLASIDGMLQHTLGRWPWTEFRLIRHLATWPWVIRSGHHPRDSANGFCSKACTPGAVTRSLKRRMTPTAWRAYPHEPCFRYAWRMMCDGAHEGEPGGGFPEECLVTTGALTGPHALRPRTPTPQYLVGSEDIAQTRDYERANCIEGLRTGISQKRPLFPL